MDLPRDTKQTQFGRAPMTGNKGGEKPNLFGKQQGNQMPVLTGKKMVSLLASNQELGQASNESNA